MTSNSQATWRIGSKLRHSESKQRQRCLWIRVCAKEERWREGGSSNMTNDTEKDEREGEIQSRDLFSSLGGRSLTQSKFHLGNLAFFRNRTQIFWDSPNFIINIVEMKTGRISKETMMEMKWTLSILLKTHLISSCNQCVRLTTTTRVQFWTVKIEKERESLH